jgi:hypothetical protein
MISNPVQINADVFNVYLSALPSLSGCIRIREFREVVTERTLGFVGRDFVFRAIDELLNREAFSSGYILIRGEPGIGKTALLSQLVKTRGYVHHFNIASQNIRSPQAFLENVCAQLIVHYGLERATIPPEAVKDSGFLTQLLSEAVRSAAGSNVIVLVDALDEAEDFGLEPSANRLYLPATLPTGVFFVLTSREQIDYRMVVDHREDIYLRDDDPQNLQDIRTYVENYLDEFFERMAQRIATWNVSRGEFIELIINKSQGNFMYLVHVLRDIHNGSLSNKTIDSVHELPQGLRAYYEQHWRIMRAKDPDRFERIYEPVLRLLATVLQPVSVSEIEEWSKIEPARIRDVIRAWRPFLNADHRKNGGALYRVYHTSFRDFLAEDGVGLQPSHTVIAEAALKKIPGFPANSG